MKSLAAILLVLLLCGCASQTESTPLLSTDDLSDDGADLAIAYVHYALAPAAFKTERFYVSVRGRDASPSSLRKLSKRSLRCSRGSLFRDWKGIYLRISDIEVSGDVAKVDASWHAGVFTGRGGEYFFVKQSTGWRFDKVGDVELVE